MDGMIIIFEDGCILIFMFWFWFIYIGLDYKIFQFLWYLGDI